MKSFPYIIQSLLFISLLTGCTHLKERLKYRPPAPENLRMTAQEKEALEEMTRYADNKHAVLHKDRIMADYLKVSKYDGIDRLEAVTLAQSELLFRGMENTYYISEPKIAQETKEDFIIEFPAINKRLATTTPPPVRVEINRTSGTVRVL